MATTASGAFPSAMAFLNCARQYYEAAEIVFASKPGLHRPLYFLYLHTAESLLKAYLKANGQERWGHEVSELCAEAQQFGLKIQSDKSGQHHLHNVMALLQSGNGSKSAFRYATGEHGSKPDLAWTHDVVAELISVVAPFVESKSDLSKSGVPVGFEITMRIQG
jgi:hypothetical protein